MELIKQITQMKGEYLLVTGGEPLLQAKMLGPVIRRLRDAGYKKVEVETNGTIIPMIDPGLVDLWNVSPKIEYITLNSFRPAVLKYFLTSNKAIFTFPASEIAELNTIKKLALPKDRIWITPRGVTQEEIQVSLENICETALKNGWNLCDRFHIRLGDCNGLRTSQKV